MYVILVKGKGKSKWTNNALLWNEERKYKQFWVCDKQQGTTTCLISTLLYLAWIIALVVLKVFQLNQLTKIGF